MISEQRNLGEEITRRTREEVFAIARKTLADLSSTSLEERMVDVFVRKLRAIGWQGKGRAESCLPIAITRAPSCAAHSICPPPSAARSQEAMKETLAIETPVNFQTAPDLVSGIEITASGRKIAWSIEDYLKSLDEGVGTLLS